MKINLEALKTLETIDRCGSFSLAAQELCRVPSALTYTIHALEEQLDIKVFDRKGHRAILTPLGKHILEEGKKLLIAAKQLEQSVKLRQSGWEETISLAYDQVIPFKNFLFLIEAFYQECPGVELKWSGEVLGGCWDALLSHRAMISIGVSGEPPQREDLSIMHLGQVEFVFLVSPHHSLAKIKGQLTHQAIRENRIIAVSDSARGFSARSSGILPGQKTLTVSTFQEKIDAMIMGLGVGYLPLQMAQPYLDEGSLLVKKVDKLKTKASFATAWRPSMVGKGMQWLINKLSDPIIQKQILM